MWTSARLKHTARRGTHMDVNMRGACSLETGPRGHQHAWSLQFIEGPTWMSTRMELAAQRGAHLDVNTHGAPSSERWMEDFSFLAAAAFAPQTGQVQSCLWAFAQAIPSAWIGLHTCVLTFNMAGSFLSFRSLLNVFSSERLSMAPQSSGRSSYYSILAHCYFALCHSSQSIMICAISLLVYWLPLPLEG